MPVTPTFPPDPNLPVVWHDAEILRQGGRDWPQPAGWFVDWQDDRVRDFVYELRTTIRPQPTCRQIAEHYRFQSWLRATRAYDAAARRIREDAARSGAEFRPGSDHRRWTRSARVRAAADVAYRTWGVELEFEHAEHRLSRGTVGRAILAIAGDLERAIYLRSGDADRWNGYGDSDHRRWSLTHDGTVAGEVVSPVAYSDRGFADISAVMAAMRSAGAYGAYNQGLHTNIGTGDLDRAGLVRLATNIMHADPVLRAYCPRSRHSHGYSASYSTATWAGIIDTFRRGGIPYERGAYNFAHVADGTAGARMEFRQFGHSMNSSKLKVWVQVCRALVTATAAGVAFTGPMTGDTLVAALRGHGLSAWAAGKFTERVAHSGRGQAAA